jgi:sulfur carrier protein
MPATRRSPLDFRMIQLTVNGQSRCFPAGDRVEAQGDDSSKRVLNISQLLEHMGLQGKRIAVERNGEIVPRSKFAQSMLVDGDRLEIVVAVGGG